MYDDYIRLKDSINQSFVRDASSTRLLEESNLDIWKMVVGGMKNGQIYDLSSHGPNYNTHHLVFGVSTYTIKEIVERWVTTIAQELHAWMATKRAEMNEWMVAMELRMHKAT